MNPLLASILAQPQSLEDVIAHQTGAGRAALLEGAKLLRAAPQIIFAGMGSSLFASHAAAALLLSHGRPALVVEASELLYYRQALCTAGTVVVLVSRSGETVEAVKLLEPLRERGIAIVGVTNESGSRLAREAGHALLVHSRPDHLVAIQSYTGTVFTLLELAAAICGGDEALWRAQCDRLPAQLEEAIRLSLETGEELREFLDFDGPLYLLGRGAALGSAQESALLFHEAARWPALAMPAAQFRHGPVEVLDRNFRAVVFVSQPATAELDRALALDLRALGGDARVIGPAAESDAPRTGAWPIDLPPVFAPLFDVLPVQVAALRQAEWRGVPPGVFQYSSLVTAAETGFTPPS